MQELRLWYNNHRKKIWITVGIIAAVIIIVQFFNFLGKRNNSNNKLIDANAISEGNTIKEIRQETNVDFESMYSAVTGNRNSYEKLKTAAEVIGDFISPSSFASIAFFSLLTALYKVFRNSLLSLPSTSSIIILNAASAI